MVGGDQLSREREVVARQGLKVVACSRLGRRLKPTLLDGKTPCWTFCAGIKRAGGTPAVRKCGFGGGWEAGFGANVACFRERQEEIRKNAITSWVNIKCRSA